MAQSTIVDDDSIQWVNGADYLETLEPHFRENLGPKDQVEENFAKYWQKTLYLDPQSSRRLDLIRFDPDYHDLTHCYHDSVEECLVLEGSVQIDGEGLFRAGDYFWRPPGWVHMGASAEGGRVLLGFEGESDESGRVSRYVSPPGDAGANALYPDGDERSLGARGRVLQVHTGQLVWQPGPGFARSEGPLDAFDLDHVSVRVLSKNLHNGKQTLLLRLEPGYRQSARGSHSVRLQAYVIDGALALGERRLEAGAFLDRPGGAIEEPLESPGGALLYAKVDGWLDYVPAA